MVSSPLVQKNKNIHILLFISTCLFIVVFHLLAYIGHYGFDDIYYARLSKQFADGTFNLDGDHFKYRWTILFFTALSYKFFGVNDFSSSLPAIIISIGIVYMLYYVLKNRPPFFLLMALVFYCFNVWTISYSDKLMADIYVAFFAFLSVVIYYRFRYIKEGSGPVFHALAFSFTLFMGFISKETIILLAPLFIFIFISDLVQKQHIRFWIVQITGSIFLLIVYGLAIKLLTGSAMSRFNAIELNSYINPCSYDLLPVEHLLKRISYEFVFYFTQMSMITGLIFVVPLLFGKKLKEIVKLNNTTDFFLVSSIVLFLSCNFMTISYKSYVPLCLDPRHYLFLIPVLSISASEGAYRLIYEKKNWFLFAGMAFIVAAIAYVNDFDSAYRKYIPLFFLIVIGKFISKEKKGIVNTYTFLLCAVIGIEVFILFRNFGETDYTRQRSVIYNQIINKKEKAFVITNKVQKYFGEYYLEFDTSNVHFITYDAAPNREIDSTYTVYILNNYYTNYLTGNKDNERPLFAKVKQDSYKSIYNENGIELYKLNSALLLEKPIYESSNNFESAKNFWEQNEERIDQQNFFEGKKSYMLKPNEYSATFKLKLSQLPGYDPTAELSIKTTVQINLIEDASPTLVISIDKNTQSISWDGLNIKEKMQVLKTWQKNELQKTVPANIDTAAVLSIYVWNNSQKSLLIDDFEVEFSQLKSNRP